MPGAEITPAPRWRTMLAGLTDAAIAAALLWGLRRRRPSAEPDRLGAQLLVRAAELMREQLGSPGQRLLGVRTVDRRTGTRVALWRTLVLLGTAAGGELLAKRLRPQPDPEAERAREGFIAELGALHERHPHDSPARDAERQALFERYPSSVERPDLLRVVGASMVVGLVNRRLRGRLAPTVDVLRRGC